jgi:drug/metabolite transporter (DMT)-like permease
MQAIIFNYGICVLTGLAMLTNSPMHAGIFAAPYIKWAILLGALFVTMFNLIAISSVKAGITVTQTANKLSLVIPVVFAWIVYHEQVSALKWAGIACAILAVILISYRPQLKKSTSLGLLEISLPLILFAGSGIIDTLTKYVQRNYLHSEQASSVYLITCFFTAFLIGSIALLTLYARGKKTFRLKYVFAGILLGVPNYFSIHFLIKALQSDYLNSSALIPINNIGILVVVSLFGIFIFHENLSKINYIGLLLSVISILLIFLGDQI